MKNKCLILGAGFSNAIANLPVTSEMIDRFKIVFDNQCKINDNSIRINRGKCLLDFINNLEIKFQNSMGIYENNGDIVLQSNYTKNFEGLCSYIDLNLSQDGHVLYKRDGKEIDMDGKSLFANFNPSKLRDIRTDICNYLYLTLIDYKSDEKLLNSFYDKFIKDCQSIITFNYDLILEKFLYGKGDWLPKDGYGFTPKSECLPEIKPFYFDQTSRVKIFKMHGSLNWEPYSTNIDPFSKRNLQFKWLEPVNNKYFFPDYLAEEKKMKYRYKGGNKMDCLLFPSLSKQFSYLEMIKTWNKAFNELTNADEVIFVGYSLPKADFAVSSLFSTIDWNNKIVKLIDPKAKELHNNYSFILRKSDIEIIPYTLKKYLDNNVLI
jgi:hypothetical protein